MVGVAPEPRVVRKVRDEVCQVDRDERPSDSESAEAPLLVYGLKTLEECEDERIGETREQRQAQNDGLGDQHDPGTHPDGTELLERDTGCLQFVRTIDVGVLAGLAPSLGLLVEDDCCAGFWHEEVNGLGTAVEDKLNPEVPTPMQDCICC